MPFLTQTQTLSAVQDLSLYSSDLGCELHSWHHELVVLFRWTIATAPGCQPVDSRCEATVSQVVTGYFLVLCRGLEMGDPLGLMCPIYPHVTGGTGLHGYQYLARSILRKRLVCENLSSLFIAQPRSDFNNGSPKTTTILFIFLIVISQ